MFGLHVVTSLSSPPPLLLLLLLPPPTHHPLWSDGLQVDQTEKSRFREQIVQEEAAAEE